MMFRTLIVTTALLYSACSHESGSRLQDANTPLSPLRRTYVLGDTVAYNMSANDLDKNGTTTYQATSSGIVNRDDSGAYFENTGWTVLTLNGTPVTLASSDLAFRQQISLDVAFNMGAHLPDIGSVDHRLAGPIFDLMNFYVDLQMGVRHNELQHAGDEKYVTYSKPSSYTNPNAGIILGEVCIDFDLTLKTFDVDAGVATLVVKHIPPPTACVSLPAPWMQVPVVTGVENNHVQVNKNNDGTYTVAVGKEDIDVEIKVQLGTGKILSATMNNPVEINERTCTDSAYTNCGAPTQYQVIRNTSIVATK